MPGFMPGIHGFFSDAAESVNDGANFGFSEISLAARPKSVVYASRPATSRGAFRDRHGRRRRDAVDVAALLTNSA